MIFVLNQRIRVTVGRLPLDALVVILPSSVLRVFCTVVQRNAGMVVSYR